MYRITSIDRLIAFASFNDILATLGYQKNDGENPVFRQIGFARSRPSVSSSIRLPHSTFVDDDDVDDDT